MGDGTGAGSPPYLPPYPSSYPPFGTSGDGGKPPEPPRDRRRLMLGTIFAVVALLIVAALVLFAVARGRDGDNNAKAAQAAMTATRSSELLAAASAAAALTRTAASPTATATAVATATPTPRPATPTATPTKVLPMVALPSPSPSAPTPSANQHHAAHIADMLPTDSDVPKGFVQVSNGQRSLADTANSFSDPTEATQKLQAWGWQGNVYRAYGLPSDVTPDPNSTTYIDVSIHRFGNAADAEAALAYFTGDVTTSLGLHEVRVPLIGDHDQGLAGAPNQLNQVVIYIQQGSILYKILGLSPAGDPTNDVIAVARKVAAK